MALITNSNVLNTEFAPATGAFVVEVGGRCNLFRRVGTGEWRKCGTIQTGESVDVPNAVAGFTYKLVALDGGSPAVAAYQ